MRDVWESICGEGRALYKPEPTTGSGTRLKRFSSSYCSGSEVASSYDIHQLLLWVYVTMDVSAGRIAINEIITSDTTTFVCGTFALWGSSKLPLGCTSA
jgi:hypothetical protein